MSLRGMISVVNQTYRGPLPLEDSYYVAVLFRGSRSKNEVVVPGLFQYADLKCCKRYFLI